MINIKLNNMQKICLKIAIMQTLRTIKELLEKTPKCTPQYDDLVETSSNLMQVKAMLEKE